MPADPLSKSTGTSKDDGGASRRESANSRRTSGARIRHEVEDCQSFGFFGTLIGRAIYFLGELLSVVETNKAAYNLLFLSLVILLLSFAALAFAVGLMLISSKLDKADISRLATPALTGEIIMVLSAIVGGITFLVRRSHQMSNVRKPSPPAKKDINL